MWDLESSDELWREMERLEAVAKQRRRAEARAIQKRFKELRSGKRQPTAIVARPGLRRVPTR